MIEDENQTLFAQDEPLMEAQTVVVDDATVDPAVVEKKNKQSRLIKAGIGAFVVLFVSLLAVAMTMPRQVQRTDAEPSPTPTTQQAQQLSELDTTLNLLHEDMLKADPSISDLPVPPIDFKLTLEEKSSL